MVSPYYYHHITRASIDLSRYCLNGALYRIRTCDFLLRRQTLYPLSYKGTAETLYAIMAEMAKQTEGLHDRRNKALAGVSDPGETMGT